MFGLSQQYPQCLSFEPDKFVPSSLLAKFSPIPIEVQDTQGPNLSHRVSELPPYPFQNMTIYHLITWMNSGSHQKLQMEVMHLVKDVIQAKDFNQKDLDEFSVRRCLHALDTHTTSKESVVFPNDWVGTDVNIDIPTKSKDDQSQSFSILGFHYWLLMGLQWQPKEPGCSLECVITGLMFFSDATHLANFGTAKAWPLYLYFGNLSKYAHSSPTSGACHVVGFFPPVCQ
jgi:hypothetical protein